MWSWLLDLRDLGTRFDSGWSGIMSLPRVISLGEDRGREGRLRIEVPVEVEKLRYRPFAKENIDKWTDLGIGWLTHGRELFRTPLGGFINHSDKPNVQKIEVDGKYYVQTLTDIKKGEEITLKYTLYKV